jgi:hypothetical protein
MVFDKAGHRDPARDILQMCLRVVTRIGIHLTDAFKDKFQWKRPCGAEHNI